MLRRRSERECGGPEGTRRPTCRSEDGTRNSIAADAYLDTNGLASRRDAAAPASPRYRMSMKPAPRPMFQAEICGGAGKLMRPMRRATPQMPLQI